MSEKCFYMYAAASRNRDLRLISRTNCPVGLTQYFAVARIAKVAKVVKAELPLMLASRIFIICEYFQILCRHFEDPANETTCRTLK